MRMIEKLVTFIIKILLHVLCKVELDPGYKVPEIGPVIIAANHISFLEVPLMYILMKPRKVTALVKAESWKSPFSRILLGNLWKGIPINRESTDMNAFRQAERALGADFFLGIAPEGTRSGDGRLRKGRSGIVTIAARLNIPILPLVHYGVEEFRNNIRKLKRTRITFKTGKMFKINTGGKAITNSIRGEMIKEIMYQLAQQLPEKYRGEYSDLSKKTEKYITYVEACE
jgi:1-acyl-sn-glycerol-3-phosphate acyltransferase